MAGTNGDTGAAPKVTTTVGKKNVHGNTKEEKWSVRTREILRSGDVAPYKEVAWFTEPLSMVVRTSLSGFLLVCLPGARRMR